MHDGDRTYMANELLLPYLTGCWRSGDGRWELHFGEDCAITLRLEGAVVLSTTAEYVHLEPGGPCDTYFTLGDARLRNGSGINLGELASLAFLMTDSGNRMELLVSRDGSAETALLSRLDAHDEGLGGVYIERYADSGEGHALRVYEAGGVLLLQNCLYMNDPAPEVYSLWMQELWPDDPALLVGGTGAVTGTAESFWVPFVPGDNPSRITLTPTDCGLCLEESLIFPDGEELVNTPVEFERAAEDVWFMPSREELMSLLPGDTRPMELVGIWAAEPEGCALWLKLRADGSFTYAYKATGEPIRLSEGLWSGDGEGYLRLAYDTVGDEGSVECAYLQWSFNNGSLSLSHRPLDSVLPSLLPDAESFELAPVGEDWCFPAQLS